MDEPHVPGYRLLRSLGAGGMGTVYEAQAETGGERVALKMLTTRSAVGRFNEEVRLGQTLRHPGLVPVLDAGGETTTPWFTMPLLRGAPLAEMRRWVPRPWPEGLVLTLARETLEALAFLHQSGVIHRDVKPSNLFLCADGSLKLIDYGIARATEGGDATLTGTGQLIGSLRYTSPEQAQGQRVDIRTDFFSLGLVLHELLSGERVFPQEDSVAVITALLMGRVARLDELRPELSAETVEAIAWMLAASPEARPGGVAEVRERWPSLERKAWPAGDVAAWYAKGSQFRDVGTGQGLVPIVAPARTPVPGPVSFVGPPAVRRRRVGWVPALLLVIAAGAAGGFAVWRHGLEKTPTPVVDHVSVRESVPVPVPVHVPVPVPLPVHEPAPVPPHPAEPGPETAHEGPLPPKQVHRRLPSGTGFLTLDVRPGWANVFIDGAKKGVTPLFRLELRAGPHRVEVVRSTGQRQRRQVTITRGELTTQLIPWE